MARGVTLGLLLPSAGFALAAAMLGGCGAVGDGSYYHYRLSVAIDTPQGIREGASVLRVSCGAIRHPGRQAADCRARGEAVSVDLPDGRTLFVLLRGKDNPDLAKYLASTPLIDKDPGFLSLSRRAQWEKRWSYLAVPRTVPRTIAGGERGSKPTDNYPMFVVFRDIGDPASAVEVDPAHLERTLGPGITLRRIAVSASLAPVTRTIGRRMPWIHDARLPGFPGRNNLPGPSRLAVTGLRW